MALPAIIGALARVGAGFAARVGATNLARTLVAVGRRAGKSAVKRAAARAAAKTAAAKTTAEAATRAASAAGAPAVAPAAAPTSPAAAPAARVLEDTTLTNAKSLFEAIHGKAMPAATPPGPTIDPLLTTVQKIVQSDSAVTASELQKALGIPAARAQTLLESAAPQATAPVVTPAPVGTPAPGAMPTAGPSPAAGGANPTPSPQPGSPPTPPPVGPTPTRPGFLDRAGQLYEQISSRYQQFESGRKKLVSDLIDRAMPTPERFRSVADQTAGMSLDQRYDRLQKAGKLLDPLLVGRQSGTPNPSREQIVNASESEEERMRQQELSQNRAAQFSQAAWGAGKKAALSFAMMASSPATFTATGPAALYGVATGFERLARTLSETNRDLVRFNERIADSFARLDYAQLRSRQRLASATSGSASFLNDQLAALVRELQPLRESFATLMNTAGGMLALMARGMALVTKMSPAIALLLRVAERVERFLGRAETQQAQAATKDFLRDIRDKKFNRP